MGLFVNVSDIGRDAFRAAQECSGASTAGSALRRSRRTPCSPRSRASRSRPRRSSRGSRCRRWCVRATRRSSPSVSRPGSSLLGMLIPPSLLLIIYGVHRGSSRSVALFLAAVLPGVLLALAFAIGVVLMATFWPSFVGDVRRARERATRVRRRPRRFRSASLPVRRCSSCSCSAASTAACSRRPRPARPARSPRCCSRCCAASSTWRRLWKVIGETGQVSVSILFLIIAASLFSRMLTLTQLAAGHGCVSGQHGLGLPGFLAAYLLLLIVLGTLLDSTSIMLIMLPLALPVAGALGANLVWFGVITTIGSRDRLADAAVRLERLRDQGQHGRSAHRARDDFPRRVSVRADHLRGHDCADGVPADQPRSAVENRAVAGPSGQRQQHAIRVQDAVRVERRLEPPHELDLRGAARVMQVLAPQRADAVLRRDRAPCAPTARRRRRRAAPDRARRGSSRQDAGCCRRCGRTRDS